VLVSDPVRSNMVSAGIRFNAEGERDLKGVPEKWRFSSVEG
jgi:hypothetical protein